MSEQKHCQVLFLSLMMTDHYVHYIQHSIHDNYTNISPQCTQPGNAQLSMITDLNSTIQFPAHW